MKGGRQQTATTGYLWVALAALAIAVGTAVAYYPAVHAGYVWDDDFYVTRNTLLTAPDGLRRIWFSLDSPSQYFPLVYTTFRLERAIWGLDPRGYHIANILLHIANALLVWLVLSRLSAKGAWLAAAIFAVHPVHVESVAWITERKNVLSLFFSLLTMLAWLAYIDCDDRRSIRWWFFAFVFYVLALFSKTTAVTLPAAMLIVIWIKRLPIDRRRILAIVPFVVWGVLMGIVTVLWERYHQGTMGPEFAMSPLERVLVASRALWFYAGKLAWPWKLAFSYGKWSVSQADPVWYVWLAGLIAVGIAMYVWRARIGRRVAAAVLFFVITPIPLLGFFSLYTFRYSYVADHYQYVASIGLIAIAAGAMSAAVGRFGKTAAVIPAAVLVALGLLTWRQCLVYKDAETLWRDTLAKTPSSAIAHTNLGRILLEQGQPDEAFSHFREAAGIAFDMPEVQNNLGVALFSKGDLRGAERCFRRAIRSDPRYADPHVNLAGVYLRQERFVAAEREARAALRINPYLTQARSNLGIALAEQGRLDEAIEQLRKALSLDPADEQSRRNLEHALSLRRVR
ncbi:MAG: tetratricopeptide repeat protein [Armatimonadota bacterium]